MSRARPLSALLGVLFGIAAIAAPRGAWCDEPANALEVTVKAAFISKFPGYVEWPAGTFADAQSPLVVGIVGDADLADELSRVVRARSSGGRPIQVARVKAFEEWPPLHVLFVGHAEADRLGAILRSVRGQPILVVTDTDNALALGSMINFALVEGHVRFEVGLGAARRSHLTLSSRLLAVAHGVVTRTP